jgi:hypothetical protein
MLKALLLIECDSCNLQFFFARVSASEPDALRFNSTVLSAMILDYHWISSDDGKSHLCLNCTDFDSDPDF